MSKENMLTPDEVTIIQMALSGLIEDLTETSKNVTMPLTPEARMMTKEMLVAAKSAHAKLAKTSGNTVQLAPYEKGDEQEFLTKES